MTIGGKTPQDAAAIIRAALAKDYLVNPQVSVTVMDYGKRRFTVIEGAIRRRVEVVIYGFFFRDGVDPAVGVREIATRRRTGRRVWACQTQVVHGYARKARG